MTTTNWRDEYRKKFYYTTGSLEDQIDFIEKTLSSAHQQWVEEVVERLEGLKMVRPKHYPDDNYKHGAFPMVDDLQIKGHNSALDAAISVIQSTTKGE